MHPWVGNAGGDILETCIYSRHHTACRCCITHGGTCSVQWAIERNRHSMRLAHRARARISVWASSLRDSDRCSGCRCLSPLFVLDIRDEDLIDTSSVFAHQPCSFYMAQASVFNPCRNLSLQVTGDVSPFAATRFVTEYEISRRSATCHPLRIVSTTIALAS